MGVPLGVELAHGTMDWQDLRAIARKEPAKATMGRRGGVDRWPRRWCGRKLSGRLWVCGMGSGAVG